VSVQAEGAYAAAWRRYRAWSRAFWIVFVSYLPAMALVHRALGGTRDTGGVIFSFATAWLLAFAIIGYRKSNFACPRCGELYFHKFDDRPWRRVWRNNPFARRCLHCGLPKWAALSSGPAATP
jgi:hypothetical protein